MDEFGSVTGPGTVRLERIFPGPIERLWAYLTEPDKRAKWLAGGPMELKAGGRVELHFNHADLSAEKTPPERFRSKACGVTKACRILRCEPPRLLSMTWGEPPEASEVTFELTPQGKDVRLVLTHRLATRPDMIGFASGWHAHLGVLSDVLEGREPRPFWTTHGKVLAEYEKRFAEAGEAHGQ